MMKKTENTNKAKLTYTAPVIEIIRFQNEDIITTSNIGLTVSDAGVGDECGWDNYTSLTPLE